ncbi:hypothetical protein B0H13DRAFT_2679421 [Mycena leptocephala]|nr:hypothetical protein B0H13DRAFT_2679421 [Mycena leptocephala]
MVNDLNDLLCFKPTHAGGFGCINGTFHEAMMDADLTVACRPLAGSGNGRERRFRQARANLESGVAPRTLIRSREMRVWEGRASLEEETVAPKRMWMADTFGDSAAGTYFADWVYLPSSTPHCHRQAQDRPRLHLVFEDRCQVVVSSPLTPPPPSRPSHPPCLPPRFSSSSSSCLPFPSTVIRDTNTDVYTESRPASRVPPQPATVKPLRASLGSRGGKT